MLFVLFGDVYHCLVDLVHDPLMSLLDIWTFLRIVIVRIMLFFCASEDELSNFERSVDAFVCSDLGVFLVLRKIIRLH